MKFRSVQLGYRGFAALYALTIAAVMVATMAIAFSNAKPRPETQRAACPDQWMAAGASCWRIY